MYNRINEKPLKKVRYMEQKREETTVKILIVKEDIDDYIFEDKVFKHSER